MDTLPHNDALKQQKAITAEEREAFAQMFSWIDDIPGWCDQDQPVAMAIQAAFWIDILANEKSAIDHDMHWSEFLTDDLRHVDQLHSRRSNSVQNFVRYALPETEHRRLEISDRASMALYQRQGDGRRIPQRITNRVIAPDDVRAADLVILKVEEILRNRDFRRRRRSGVRDWQIVAAALIDHLSVREAAVELGLDESGAGVARRLREAIAEIANEVGRFEHLAFDHLASASWHVSAAPKALSPHFGPPVCQTYNGEGKERPPLRKRLRPVLRQQTRHPPWADVEENRRLIDAQIGNGGPVTQCEPGLAVKVPAHNIRGRRTNFYDEDELLAATLTLPRPAWQDTYAHKRIDRLGAYDPAGASKFLDRTWVDEGAGVKSSVAVSHFAEVEFYLRHFGNFIDACLNVQHSLENSE